MILVNSLWQVLPLYPRDSLYLSPMMGLLVFGLSDFLWDSAFLQGHDNQPMKDFLMREARSIPRSINPLHGASMIQLLYHQEPGVVGGV